MLEVKNNGIKLTRGDTARLTVPIENDCTGEPYTVQPDDTLTLSVKRSVSDKTYVMQKFVKGSNDFHIEPKDTQKIACGRYVYDVELNTADGDTYTVVDPTPFELTSEVTRNE